MGRRKQQPTNSKVRKVALIHTPADAVTADMIEQQLLRQPVINVSFTAYEIRSQDSIATIAKNAFQAHSYVIVLISPYLQDVLKQAPELDAIRPRESSYRDVTVLPVRVGHDGTLAPFPSYQYLDLPATVAGVNRLIELIGYIPRIDFSHINERGFERLVVDLLTARGFNTIQEQVELPSHPSKIVDFTAKYTRLDPFGVRTDETWIIEAKFYRTGRADLKSVQQLADYLSELPAETRGLVIANSQLTSATWVWLDSVKAKRRVEIRVINGTELKRLLLHHSDLIKKHFPHSIVQ